MHISEQGLSLIKRFEGFHAYPYKDSAGILTVGYGDTHNVRPGVTVCESEADGNLRNYIAGQVEPAINIGVHVGLTQDQFDALCSFVFNVGSGAFLSSTLLRGINAGSPLTEIQAQIQAWDHAGGKEIEGLKTRRQTEAKLYGGGA